MKYSKGQCVQTNESLSEVGWTIPSGEKGIVTDTIDVLIRPRYWVRFERVGKDILVSEHRLDPCE